MGTLDRRPGSTGRADAPEQFKAFVEGIKELMADPNRKEPVDPFRQPLYPPPARSLEEVREGMRQHQIKVLMRDFPTMSPARERRN